MDNSFEYKIVKTEIYSKWFKSIKDNETKFKIDKRIDRIRVGNFGDSKILGDNVWELRLNFGSGYRIYYTKRENIIIILLCGGDKSTQSKDIERAKKLASEV